MIESPENQEEGEKSRMEDCSNRDYERGDQAKHQNSSTEPHCRPEKYPRQLGKEGEKNRSVDYSFKLWKYLSAWVNGLEQPLREKVDEMIENIKNNPDYYSLATNRHDQNSPTFPPCLSNEVPKLVIEDKDSMEENIPSNVLDKDPFAPGPSHSTFDVCYRGESDKAESRYSTFEPGVTIVCSNDGPQELSFAPSVDPVPILQPTIHGTENNSLTLFDRALTDTGPSRFSCDECKEVFEYEYDFMNHSCKLNIEDKRYNCEYCDKSFKYENYLSQHSCIHTDEKSHKCDKCGKSFSTKSYLKKHDKGCGSTDKKYACKECPKKYRYKIDLESHYRKHTGEMPYECNKCGKKYSNPKSFSRHEKSCGFSADDRPYACDKCNKKFTLKQHLVNHSPIHSCEKLYKCMKCGKDFLTKNYLRKHEKICGRSLLSKQ